MATRAKKAVPTDNEFLGEKKVEEVIHITPPDFATYQLLIVGTAPLVVERFSKKAELMEKMASGSQANSRRKRTARDYEKEVEDARYRSPEGWEGMNAAAFRSAMISACRLVGFKMTIAKMCVFVVNDDFDHLEGLPIVRIYGESRTFTQHTRNATGVADVRARPQYKEWAINLKIKFDRGQFSVTDITNLMMRVGVQVGIGAGRPDSKDSAGCGWGTFDLVSGSEEAKVRAKFGI